MCCQQAQSRRSAHNAKRIFQSSPDKVGIERSGRARWGKPGCFFAKADSSRIRSSSTFSSAMSKCSLRSYLPSVSCWRTLQDFLPADFRQRSNLLQHFADGRAVHVFENLLHQQVVIRGQTIKCGFGPATMLGADLTASGFEVALWFYKPVIMIKIGHHFNLVSHAAGERYPFFGRKLLTTISCMSHNPFGDPMLFYSVVIDNGGLKTLEKFGFRLTICRSEN